MTESVRLIDWDLAVATATRLAPRGPAVTREEAFAAVRQLRDLALEAEDHVTAFTGMKAPHPHEPAEPMIDIEKHIGARALIGLEGAEDVFGSERAEIVVVHDVRHCSISNRLRRSEPLRRLAGVLSLTASCSRLNAP